MNRSIFLSSKLTLLALCFVPFSQLNAQNYTCNVVKIEWGQLRNSGITGDVKVKSKSGKFSLNFDENSKSVSIQNISGDSSTLEIGNFSYSENYGVLIICKDACGLTRKETSKGAVTTFSSGLSINKELKIIMRDFWYYIDFHNAPYDDSFAVNESFRGSCEAGA